MRSRLKSTLLIIGLAILGILTLTGNAAAQFGELMCLTGVLCIVPVIWIIICILIAVWVYRHAESRGMSGVLWLIIVILLGIIGLIIYLVVRHPKVPVGAPPPGAYPPPGRYPPPPPRKKDRN